MMKGQKLETKTMRKLYLLMMFGLMSSLCFAQYDKSAGIRLGNSSGVTFKKFVHMEEAIELLLSGRNDGLQLTGLYQFHKPMDWNFTDRIYMKYGVGGHFGYGKHRRYTEFIDPISQPGFPFGQTEFASRNHHQFTMGIDAIVGLEYRCVLKQQPIQD